LRNADFGLRVEYGLGREFSTQRSQGTQRKKRYKGFEILNLKPAFSTSIISFLCDLCDLCV
jgi:hypothetical protein